MSRSPHDDPPRRKREPPGPPPTLAELAKQPPFWMWVHCPGCRRWKPLRLGDAIATAGASTTSVAFMRRLRCISCGHRGAQLQAPSWSNSVDGWQRYEDAPPEVPGSP